MNDVALAEAPTVNRDAIQSPTKEMETIRGWLNDPNNKNSPKRPLKFIRLGEIDFTEGKLDDAKGFANTLLEKVASNPRLIQSTEPADETSVEMYKKAAADAHALLGVILAEQQLQTDNPNFTKMQEHFSDAYALYKNHPTVELFDIPDESDNKTLQDLNMQETLTPDDKFLKRQLEIALAYHKHQKKVTNALYLGDVKIRPESPIKTAESTLGRELSEQERIYLLRNPTRISDLTTIRNVANKLHRPDDTLTPHEWYILMYGEYVHPTRNAAGQITKEKRVPVDLDAYLQALKPTTETEITTAEEPPREEPSKSEERPAAKELTVEDRLDDILERTIRLQYDSTVNPIDIREAENVYDTLSPTEKAQYAAKYDTFDISGFAPGVSRAEALMSNLDRYMEGTPKEGLPLYVMGVGQKEVDGETVYVRNIGWRNGGQPIVLTFAFQDEATAQAFDHLWFAHPVKSPLLHMVDQRTMHVASEPGQRTRELEAMAAGDEPENMPIEPVLSATPLAATQPAGETSGSTPGITATDEVTSETPAPEKPQGIIKEALGFLKFLVRDRSQESGRKKTQKPPELPKIKPLKRRVDKEHADWMSNLSNAPDRSGLPDTRLDMSTGEYGPKTQTGETATTKPTTEPAPQQI